MAIFSVELCKKKVETWLRAEEAIATSQEYKIGTRTLTRADLDMVRDELEFWMDKLAEAEAVESSGGRNRVYHVTLRDV